MCDSGWVKLHRELMDKAIWRQSTAEQKVILITILMMANHDEKRWFWKGEMYTCKPGQFITSLPSLAEAAGKDISIQNVRTALNKFKKYEFLTDESTGSGRLITIVNWAKYQREEQKDNNQLTDNQQTTNSQLTANKNDKNIESLKENCILTDTAKEKPPKPDKVTPVVKEVVGYLNEKTGFSYSAKSKHTVSLIKARLREGHTVDDFKKVVDIKCAEWTGDPKMESYLRPNTLFASAHFDDYLNQKPRASNEVTIKPKGNDKIRQINETIGRTGSVADENYANMMKLINQQAVGGA